jgi:hypothetical protein
MGLLSMIDGVEHVYDNHLISPQHPLLGEQDKCRDTFTCEECGEEEIYVEEDEFGVGASCAKNCMGSRYEVCKEEKEGQDYESMNALSYTC